MNLSDLVPAYALKGLHAKTLGSLSSKKSPGGNVPCPEPPISAGAPSPKQMILSTMSPSNREWIETFVPSSYFSIDASICEVRTLDQEIVDAFEVFYIEETKYTEGLEVVLDHNASMESFWKKNWNNTEVFKLILVSINPYVFGIRLEWFIKFILSLNGEKNFMACVSADFNLVDLTRVLDKDAKIFLEPRGQFMFIHVSKEG